MGRFPTMLLASTVFVACGVEYPAPVVTGVNPERGWNGADTVVTISGSNFYPQVWVEAGNRERVDDNFNVYLRASGTEEEYPLTGSILGYDRMDALVKPGLPLGVYDVVVESPSGKRGELLEGFTVTDSVAARIELNPAAETAAIQTGIPVAVYLVDAVGERVTESGLGVRFWLTDAAGDRHDDVQFSPNNMFAIQQPTEPGGDLTAVLGTNSNLVVTVDEPGAYDLHAAPQRDTSISQASEGLEWTQADIAPLEIRLPSSPFVARAGDPFQIDLSWNNVLGDPAPDHQGTVVLLDACTNTLVYDATFTGSTSVQVTLNTPCADPTWIENTRDGGRSADFQVIPGAPDHIAVLAPVGPVIAGQEFVRSVFVQDVAGNATDYPGGTITLSSSTGGLQASSCTPVVGGIVGEFECRGTPTIANNAVTLSATGTPGGLTGVSPSFAVLADSANVDSITVTAAASVVAGDVLQLTVDLRDAFGNDIDGATVADTDWLATDDLGEAGCAWTGTTPTGDVRFDCIPTTARPDATFDVTLVSEGISDSSGLVDVVNGPLDAVAVTVTGPDPLQPHTVVAGTAFDLALEGFDAFGNPALVLADPTVDLSTVVGGLSPSQATLDNTGQALVAASLEVAGQRVIEVRQLGLLVGSSSTITVLPASTAALRVSVIDAPWAWVGEAEDVRVEATDAFGNRTAWSGTATLQSLGTATPSESVTVTNGVGTTAWTWIEPTLDEVLEATAPPGWTGTSDSLDIAARCAPSGPTAVVDFAGFDEAVACIDPVSGVASTSASFAGSLAGADPIVRHAVEVDGTVFFDPTTTVDFDLPSAGIHGLRAWVVDDAGCGHAVEARGYAGPADGQPVGPITLVPAALDIDAGGAPTAVDVLAVTDCSRDLAVGVDVRVRTTRGELINTVPTGAGLAVTTDVNGDASFLLDPLNTAHEGEAELVAWVPSGAASGAASVQIDNDFAKPTVWAQDPDGQTVGLVSSVDVVFSEPMLVGSIRPLNALLTGPGASVVSTASVDPSGTVATFTLDPPADPALGVWTLTLTTEIRDDAGGNRLSGDWSGNVAAYVGSFGGPAGAVDPVTCTATLPAEGRFRPDGDDGVGVEADVLEVDLQTVAAPAWWEIAVRDEAGTVLLIDRAVPGGAVDTIVWDGRGQDGAIVGNGTYEVSVVGVDGQGNRGTACVVDAVVDNEGVP